MPDLPLRHRQILDYLKHSTGYTTGQALAEHLHTSSRTIRTYIADINEALAGTGIRILSKHRFGYILSAPDPKELDKLTRSKGSFLSRNDRLRHIAFCLCLRDDFQDIDELADEMYISKTTLELDLKAFRRAFLLVRPYIRMIRRKNAIAFENDERKKRYLLLLLFSGGWNYNGRGNTFYSYHYLDEKTVNLCVREVNYYMDFFELHMDDVNVVHMVLMSAILLHRLRDGHALSDSREIYTVPTAVRMADALADSLEEKLGCVIPDPERRELYELASCSILPDMDLLRQKPLRETFPDTLIDLADTYLHLLEEEYALSFQEDEDFYLTLLLYLQYLGKPIHNLNRSDISDRIIRVDHAVEFELAFRFQPLALSYYGNYLDFIELFYLMNILSGAIRNINAHQVRTVIMSYYNMPSAWNLRRMVEDSFREKIVVTALLPMHLKDSFDFSDTDLILTNADKQVVTDRELTVLKISPYFTDDDQRRIRGFLNQVRLRSLYRKDYPDITDLLRTADWEEKSDETVYLNLLDSVTKHEVQGGFITEECRLQILNHESLATFATHPVYIIVHTEVPAKETHIRVTTLDHRIVVGGHKIRMVILLCLKDTERGLLFKFYNELYGGDFDPNECRFMKTKEEFLEFFSKNLGT